MDGPEIYKKEGHLHLKRKHRVCVCVGGGVQTKIMQEKTSQDKTELRKHFYV